MNRADVLTAVDAGLARKRKAFHQRRSRARALGVEIDEPPEVRARPPEDVRWCRRCGCRLNSYNRGSACAPCSRPREERR